MQSSKRGLAYRCGKCPQLIAEKYRVASHFYKTHLALDQAPFYCTLCMFKAGKKADLQKHVKSYTLHKQRLEERLKQGALDEAQFLKESQDPYILTDKDVVPLSTEESLKVWEERSKNTNAKLAAFLDNIMSPFSIVESEASLPSQESLPTIPQLEYDPSLPSTSYGTFGNDAVYKVKVVNGVMTLLPPTPTKIVADQPPLIETKENSPTVAPEPEMKPLDLCTRMLTFDDLPDELLSESHFNPDYTESILDTPHKSDAKTNEELNQINFIKAMKPLMDSNEAISKSLGKIFDVLATQMDTVKRLERKLERVEAKLISHDKPCSCKRKREDDTKAVPFKENKLESKVTVPKKSSTWDYKRSKTERDDRDYGRFGRHY